MKRQKRLTKRERKSQDPHHRPGPNASAAGGGHIHCIACGRHIDPEELSSTPATATFLTCDHGSRFAACTSCTADAQARIDAHERTGQPVQVTGAWH